MEEEKDGEGTVTTSGTTTLPLPFPFARASPLPPGGPRRAMDSISNSAARTAAVDFGEGHDDNDPSAGSLLLLLPKSGRAPTPIPASGAPASSESTTAAAASSLPRPRPTGCRARPPCTENTTSPSAPPPPRQPPPLPPPPPIRARRTLVRSGADGRAPQGARRPRPPALVTEAAATAAGLQLIAMVLSQRVISRDPRPRHREFQGHKKMFRGAE